MRLETAVTTIHVLYYRPDARSLLQSFMWQTDDCPPEFPRMRGFLDHWYNHIDAVIAEIMLSYRLGARQMPVNVKEIFLN